MLNTDVRTPGRYRFTCADRANGLGPINVTVFDGPNRGESEGLKCDMHEHGRHAVPIAELIGDFVGPLSD